MGRLRLLSVSTLTVLALGPGCGSGTRDMAETAGETGLTGGTDDGTGGTTDDGEPPPELYDVGDGDPGATAGDGGPVCKVPEGQDDAPGDCTDVAPPDSFDPEIQWSFTPDDGNTMALALPLVANMTDDNGDGEIDLCDTPDVVLTAMKSIGSATQFSSDPSYIYVIDGATGKLHYKIPDPVGKLAQPALGDIDNDGLVELIVSMEFEPGFAVYEHDGTLKFKSDDPSKFVYDEAPSLYDLDADGDVEIIMGDTVFDHEGHELWYGTNGSHHATAASTAADLDDDGYLEVVVGHAAYRWDGELYYLNTDIGDGGTAWASGYPAVANFDDDDDPEILVTNEKGASLLEADGTAVFTMETPTGDAPILLNWARPAAVHDFDGDGISEWAVSSAAHFSVIRRDFSVMWTVDVDDPSGAAGSTAFDFLGDGTAEAMYADERNFMAYDGSDGSELLQNPRLSRTQAEYPVVADIDNDGSAEVLVVSNETIQGEDDAEPTLIAIRDKGDRWIPARRIWNQHAYHVTNVREDGTIPQVPAKHWLELNTFRTQAQVSDGGVCKPKPQG